MRLSYRLIGRRDAELHMMMRRQRCPSRAYGYILRSVLGDSNYRSFRAVALLARRQRDRGPRWRRILYDRTRFIAGVIRTIASIRFGRRPDPVADRLIEPSNDPEIIGGRRYYVQKHFSVDAVPLHWRSSITVSSPADAADVLRALWMCMRCLIACDTSDVPLVPIWKFLMYRLAIRRSGASRVFVFDYSYIDTYLLVRELGRTDIETVYAPSNSTLFDDARYGVYEGVTIATCAAPQLEEVASFKAIGWWEMHGVEVVHTGNPFAYELDAMPREQLYDIAFYSSGEWASRNGVWRVDDVAGIRQGRYAYNEYDRLARLLIATLSRIARTHDWRFVVHLHPYERLLLRQHGIAPPFLKQLDGRTSLAAPDSGRRHSNIFDARVGVVTLSSVLFDRVEAGLPTLVYSPSDRRRAPGRAYYRLRHIPSLQASSFESPEQMADLLMAMLMSPRGVPLAVQGK